MGIGLLDESEDGGDSTRADSSLLDDEFDLDGSDVSEESMFQDPDSEGATMSDQLRWRGATACRLAWARELQPAVSVAVQCAPKRERDRDRDRESNFTKWLRPRSR